jgi:hypothetical protein
MAKTIRRIRAAGLGRLSIHRKYSNSLAKHLARDAGQEREHRILIFAGEAIDQSAGRAMTSRSKPAAPRKRKTASAMTAREELVRALAQNPRFKLAQGGSATVIGGAKPLR